MNMVRELYLSTYCEVDRLDSYIASAGIGYRCWRYYHSPMNHAKAMAIAVAYSFYQECMSGDLFPEWELTEEDKKFNDFQEFQQRLGEQMMDYDPMNQFYIGDEKQRVVTQSSYERQQQFITRRDSRHHNFATQNYESNVSSEAINNSMNNGRCGTSGLSQYDHLMHHFYNSETKKYDNGQNKKDKCAFYGDMTTFYCNCCNKFVCNFMKKVGQKPTKLPMFY